MSVNDNTAISLQVVAALAQKLSKNYSAGAHWPGQTLEAIQEIEKHLADAKRTIPSSY